MSKLVDEAVSDFFSLLLHDDTAATKHEAASPLKRPYKAPNDTMQAQALTTLLSPVNTARAEEAIEQDKVAEQQELNTDVISSRAAQRVEVKVEQTAPSATQDKPSELLMDQLDEEFQVLFFKVAGLTLAVPLVTLGGIINLTRINHIMGRPDWYLGVQQHRESQLNVVDTGAWVMPEKYDHALAQQVNYQYIVQLQDSAWGLACESLINTVKIKKSQVNWRQQAGKRPWLAGVVKSQMCGILNVDALIKLLSKGLDSQATPPEGFNTKHFKGNSLQY